MSRSITNKNAPAIEFKHVWFSYDSHVVLQDVSFSITDKDFLALIGPNGGGKTTLLKLCLGLLHPQKGTIRIYGKEPEKMRKILGYVPQNPNPNPNFPVSVIDVVLMGRLSHVRLGRKYTKEDYNAAIEALDRVGMKDFRDSPIEKLSGGQKQRVFLARALAADPKILLLDEPTTGIDAPSQSMLFELLRELNSHMTIVLVTHDTIAISRYIKTVACVNQRLFLHEEGKITKEMLDATYQCPVDLIAHGIPHRVFDEHNHVHEDEERDK
ncbi:MAG: ABC transporter [Deltaproteobacteria bacterium]|nr:MAG: ABC transporter [Deltaproteobacteria bacterium]